LQISTNRRISAALLTLYLTSAAIVAAPARSDPANSDARAASPWEELARCKRISGEPLSANLSLIRLECAKTHVFVIEERLGHDTAGRAIYNILDLMHIPPLTAEEAIVVRRCEPHDLLQPATWALVKRTAESRYDQVEAAWRFDLRVGEIRPIGASDLQCGNEIRRD